MLIDQVDSMLKVFKSASFQPPNWWASPVLAVTAVIKIRVLRERLSQ